MHSKVIAIFLFAALALADGNTTSSNPDDLTHCELMCALEADFESQDSAAQATAEAQCILEKCGEEKKSEARTRLRELGTESNDHLSSVDAVVATSVMPSPVEAARASGKSSSTPKPTKAAAGSVEPVMIMAGAVAVVAVVMASMI